MKTKLLPCPFCGSAAELDTQRGAMSMRGKLLSQVAIYCTACDAEISACREDLPDFSDEEIIEDITARWNRRSKSV